MGQKHRSIGDATSYVILLPNGTARQVIGSGHSAEIREVSGDEAHARQDPYEAHRLQLEHLGVERPAVQEYALVRARSCTR